MNIQSIHEYAYLRSFSCIFVVYFLYFYHFPSAGLTHPAVASIVAFRITVKPDSKHHGKCKYYGYPREHQPAPDDHEGKSAYCWQSVTCELQSSAPSSSSLLCLRPRQNLRHPASPLCTLLRYSSGLILRWCLCGPSCLAAYYNYFLIICYSPCSDQFSCFI